jgi:dTDP-4-amino-4,6-dideoxygalactose transaminase
MSNIVAAIGVGQLEVLDSRVQRRREIFARYQDMLSGVNGITFMPEPDYARGNRWLTVILIDPDEFGADTHAVRLALEAVNIEARPVWKPMHMQPVFRDMVDKYQSERRRSYAVCEDLFARGLCLPSGTAMSDSDIERICSVILGVHARR